MPTTPHAQGREGGSDTIQNELRSTPTVQRRRGTHPPGGLRRNGQCECTARRSQLSGHSKHGQSNGRLKGELPGNLPGNGEGRRGRAHSHRVRELGVFTAHSVVARSRTRLRTDWTLSRCAVIPPGHCRAREAICLMGDALVEDHQAAKIERTTRRRVFRLGHVRQGGMPNVRGALHGAVKLLEEHHLS